MKFLFAVIAALASATQVDAESYTAMEEDRYRRYDNRKNRPRRTYRRVSRRVRRSTRKQANAGFNRVLQDGINRCKALGIQPYVNQCIQQVTASVNNGRSIVGYA